VEALPAALEDRACLRRPEQLSEEAGTTCLSYVAAKDEQEQLAEHKNCHGWSRGGQTSADHP
jgi:hypothetical protein